jgi:hypothetical protein
VAELLEQPPAARSLAAGVDGTKRAIGTKLGHSDGEVTTATAKQASR